MNPILVALDVESAAKAVALLAVVFAAAVWPAHAATRVEPIVALRID